MTKNTELPSPLKRAAQFGEIGAPRSPERASVETPERTNANMSEHTNVSTLQRHNDQATAGAPEMKRQTVYMPKELATWLKVHAASIDDDISGIITRLVEHYRAQQTAGAGER